MKGPPVSPRLRAKNRAAGRWLWDREEGDRTGGDGGNWPETNSWGSLCVCVCVKEAGLSAAVLCLSGSRSLSNCYIGSVFLSHTSAAGRKAQGSLTARAVKNERMCNMRQGNSCMCVGRVGTGRDGGRDGWMDAWMGGG